MAGFAIMLFGTQIFTALGMAPPQWYYAAQERKFMVLFGLFILGNNLNAALTSTGAFEITLIDPQQRETLLWSKLQTGNVPSPDAALRLLRGRLFTEIAGSTSGFQMPTLHHHVA